MIFISIKVLIADDSPLTRKILKTLVESDERFKVIGMARDGIEAIEKTNELNPDVILMDIKMPNMDGLTALQYILEKKNIPVIVISSLGERHSIIAYEALELGAFDYIEKPDDLYYLKDELIKKMYAAYLFSLSEKAKKKFFAEKEISIESKEKKEIVTAVDADYYAVAIGISTGGPRTIYDVLPKLPANLNAAVFLVQHIPAQFTKTYAERLDMNCELKVVEAEENMKIKPGYVYVGRGGYHLKVRKDIDGIKILLSKTPNHLFIPSADIMMESVLEVYGNKTVGVLMTGMGNDGANAMVKIKKAGGYTIAESEETAVVFGMPAEAIRLGGTHKVLPSYNIAKEIIMKVGLRNEL
ncbi:two-component system, chemotaxis family, response regulator CheB [Marinitoga hydrogenitolerans DSM 16785]|uniref:Protein-glutamate methylesterase/protein-glutamine glutaminase n=1 Tax=Marinitoga hydrogenitolerans (strain DSM 16785 / JCM 12826 / AT1271) TaxID=1122195 RepID=A0A1M4UIG7_MARH1|nr:chemotaxis-specific protein-glutamate methyltransferase CheB [Marinitoga hydrogenitolerans]SHE56562.1 two-component system, chemotaxis family, response regulator CheB [Marinitoga hydrogenitolerans DSM 16785]